MRKRQDEAGVEKAVKTVKVWGPVIGREFVDPSKVRDR